MSVIAAALRELIAAGVTGDALVTAVERIEESQKPKRNAGAERTARWRERKKKAANVTSDACDVTPSQPQEASQVTHVTSQVTPPLILSSTEEELPKEKKERGRKRAAPLPADWKPPERAYAIAAELGLEIPSIEPRFRDYLAASGKLYADYDAGFCNFVRNTPKFNGGSNGTGNRNNRANSAAGPTATGADAILAGMGRLASRVGRQGGAVGSGDGQISGSPNAAGGPPAERDAADEAAAARRRAEQELLKDARSGRWG